MMTAPSATKKFWGPSDKMKRLCIIGNSHTVALKRGSVKAGTGNPRLEITFFSASQGQTLKLEAVNNTLRPLPGNAKLLREIGKSSNGLTKIDPEQYDLFLVMGLSKDVTKMVGVMRDAYSGAARAQAIRDFWEQAPLTVLARRLVSITSKPVYVGHNPLVASKKLNDQAPENYVRFIALSNELVFNPDRITLLAQPLETIVNGKNTRVRFARGYGQNNKKMDGKHMDDAFGKLWLESMLKTALADL